MAGPTDETFTESPGQATALTAPHAHLVMLFECDRPFEGSSRHSLKDITEVTLGRGPERSAVRSGGRLALMLPGGWLSTTHVRLRGDRADWVLEDAGSHNGTRVNGMSVVHHALADGDVIEAGRALLLFRAALHAPASAPLDLDTRSLAPQAPGLVTLVPALAAEMEALMSIARASIPVLLRGETGTGKEVAARAIHAASGRAGAFIAVNCGALPVSLVESTLFGHVKGAFTGAVRDEPGFLRASSAGTLFLDEIGDLPPTSQAALLRALQDGEVTPVGTTRTVPVDLRVVAATHRPLESFIASGAFRADLLARLDGFTFRIPPLRERLEDLGLLIGDLLRDAGADKEVRFAPEVGRALVRYNWPLNVRELEHVLARVCSLAGGERRVELRHLPPEVRMAAEPELGDAPAAQANEARLKRQLEMLLSQHKGDVARVARSLGKARMQVYRWLKRFGLDADRYRHPQ